MSPRERQAIEFTGVRMRFDSDKTYDELVADLFADVGSTPVPIDDFPQTTTTWTDYQRKVESHVGPSGFILFARLDHGRWLKNAGIESKALRVTIGNPLIAITMLRHDITAGLFAPVELLLLEEADGRSSLTYVKPSSLMVIAPNEPLLTAAQRLDEKLEALAAKVVSR
jgi:uncharacterized protein (DUF302 family)